MSLPDPEPRETVRPVFRVIAWFVVACFVAGALAALWAIVFETMTLRERLVLAVLILTLGLGIWAFLVAALGRDIKPPERRLSPLLAMIPVACLAAIAWEYFSGPHSKAEIVWLAAFALMNVAWLYSFVTGKAPLRLSR